MSRLPIPELDRAMRELRDDLYLRERRKSQREALQIWQEREQAPGLMARMTPQAYDFYDFSERKTFGRRGYDRRTRQHVDRRPYHKNGDFRAQLKKRRVKTNRGTTARATLKIGGGPLNALRDQHGATDVTLHTHTETVRVSGGPVAGYINSRSGKRVAPYRRTGYTRTRTRTTRTYDEAPLSYTEEWRRAWAKDQPWLQRADIVIYRRRMKALILTKTGKIKSRYRPGGAGLRGGGTVNGVAA